MHPQPGDIILYPAGPMSALSSRIVGAAQMLLGVGHGLGVYSHCAIMASPSLEYEAVFPWSGLYPIDESRPYEVWTIDGLTDAQRLAILRDCAAHQGELYDFLTLLTFGLFQNPHLAVCSQWLGRRFMAADIKIPFEGRRILAPDAIPDFKRAKLVWRHQPHKRS